MFYSHQLLAKKAPLGQIWMAATMHAKINRRKLDKLNIIKICEEILNPSVPMALRLSGILMGGVVIVYERKVKLLYEDVTRLLIEINEAWKIKTVADPTVFPKGKNKAKYEAVTLPDNEDTDIPGMELLSNTTTTLRFHVQPTTGLDMRLDHIEEHYINIQNEGGEELPQNHHQADADNITMLDTFDTHQADTSMFNRFERFDIEDYEDGPMNSAIQEGTLIPSPQGTLIPSPPRQEEPQQVEQMNAKKGTEHSRPFTRSQAADEIQDTHPEPENNQQSDEIKGENQQAQHDEQRPRQTKRKAIKKHHIVMDFEQTIIVGQVYQTWLQDPSDILSERGRKKKKTKPMSTIKMDHLMELPPVALISGLPENGTGKIHYPTPLLDLWRRCTQSRPLRDSSSGEISPPQPPASSSPEPVYYNQDPMEIPVEDLRSAIDSQFKELSLEKMRNPDNMEIPVVGINLISTPGNSGDKERSIPSSASGNDVLPFEQTEQLTSGRVGTKRLSSSLRSGLAPVSEENPSNFDEPHFTSNFDEEPQFKLRRLSQNEPFHDHDDVLIETGPTQTQHPLYDYEHTMDKITDSIRRHLKTHFDTPGAPEIESLNQLTSGMNRKKAAQLFYQTCVLATHHLLKVEQKVPYADILISRGPKM